jgi:fibronectin-binding autotransporter adhesin
MSTPENWIANGPSPTPVSASTTDLYFNSSTVTTLSQNLANPLLLNRMVFGTTASAFTFQGNGLQFAANGTITNNSRATQTLYTTVQLSGNLNIAITGDLVMASPLISSSVGNQIRKTGSGTLTLIGGNRTYGGALVLQAGGLKLDQPDVMGAGTVILATGTRLSFASGLDRATLGGLSSTGEVILGGTTLTVDSVFNHNFAGTISGSGGFRKTGTAVQTLGGANTFSGPTRIDGGQLLLAHADALKTSVVSVDVNNGLSLGTLGAASIAGLAGSGNLELGTATLTVDAAGTTLYSGQLGGTGTLRKAGAGKLTLSGSQSGFTGLLDVAGGELVLDGTNTLAQVNVAEGTVLRTAGAGTNPVSIGSLRGTGQVVLDRGLALVGATGEIFSGTFQGASDVQLLKGLLTLTGARTEFQNRFEVGGTLNLGHADAVGSARLQLLDGGKLTTVPALADLRLTSLGGAAGSFADLGTTHLTLTVDPQRAATFAGNLRTSGNLTVAGSGTQRFAGGTTVGGTVRARGDVHLTIDGDAAAMAYTAQDRARLTIGARQLNFAPVTASTAATVVYTSPDLVGGTLGGRGTHDVAAVRRFTGTSFASGVTINPADGAALVAVNNMGTVNVLAGRSVDFNLGSNQLGTLDVAGTAQLSGWSSVGGRLAVRTGGNVVVSDGDLALGAGSTLTLGSKAQPGGTLTLSDTDATLQLMGGSLLVNNGVLNGALAVHYGALAKGAGTFNGSVTVNDGGRFSPGNSPGTVTTGDATWGEGGSYLLELASASGIAGTGWDLWNVNGRLDVASGTTANSVFTVRLATLDANDNAALLSDFDAGQDYSWTVLRTTDGIFGFDASHVVLDSAGFANPLNGGSFALVQRGNDLVLNFNTLAAPVPEPGTWAMLVAGIGVLGVAARRRNAAALTVGQGA